LSYGPFAPGLRQKALLARRQDSTVVMPNVKVRAEATPLGYEAPLHA